MQNMSAASCLYVFTVSCVCIKLPFGSLMELNLISSPLSCSADANVAQVSKTVLDEVALLCLNAGTTGEC